jgi:flagellar motor switch/type III secretory pathway protein FliN
MSEREISARDSLFKRCPVDIGGIVLPEVSALLGQGEVSFHIAGVSSGPVSKQGFAAVALSKTDAYSYKTVLGISDHLAAGLVDATLGRSPRSRSFSIKNCSLGEIGALLFALDRMGKDWLDAGGESFVVRGLLEDTNQIPDYLGGPEELEVEGMIHTAEAVFPMKFWCGAPGRGVTVKRRSLKGAFPWNVRIAVCVGWSALSLDDVKALGVDDKIVLDAWNHPMGRGGPPSCLLWNRSFRRFGRFVGSAEIEVNLKPEQEVNMDGTNHTAAPEQTWMLRNEDEDYDAGMNVVVRVEVGSLKMPVEEALRLVPGRVIKLDREVGPAVNIYVGDKLLGRGLLVDADGFLAVEIKELQLKS